LGAPIPILTVLNDTITKREELNLLSKAVVFYLSKKSRFFSVLKWCVRTEIKNAGLNYLSSTLSKKPHASPSPSPMPLFLLLLKNG